MRLIITSDLADPDGFCAVLLAAHKGLTEAESAALNARLVLVLVNHVGGGEALEKALALACRAIALQPGAPDTGSPVPAVPGPDGCRPGRANRGLHRGCW